MNSTRLLLTTIGLALGCTNQDPILDRADELEAASGTSPRSTDQPSPTGVRSADPPQGTPAEPAPVQPADPPPANPGEPSAGRAGTPAPGQPKPPPPPDDSASFTLAGEVVLDDHKGGTIRVDIFDGDQKAASGGGKRPSVVAMARMEAPGPFAVTIPTRVSKVWVGAFADEDRDGKPGPLDPEVWYGGNPVIITADTAGIRLVLERREPPPNQ